MKKLIIALLMLGLAGCVQTGTGNLGNGQLDPEEIQAIEQVIDLLEGLKDKDDQEPVEPPVVVEPPVIVEPPPIVVEPPATTLTKETLDYLGRYNGDRPTWYGSKLMKQYPATFYLTVPGCIGKTTVTNNGVRWENAGIICKQSDVPGRGLGVVLPASCKSTKAYLEY